MREPVYTKETVGVRQLREELADWLDAVRRGAEILVTDRGKPIARIVAVDGEDPLERLIREGRAYPPRRPKKPLRRRPKLKIPVSSAEILKEIR